jgi:hypothetical protein
MTSRRLGGFGVIVFGLSLGCSSSTPSGGGDPAAAFAGNWTFQSGSVMPMCSGITIPDVNLTGDPVTITRDDATHIHLVTTNGITCNVALTVSGTTATVAANQTCTIVAPAPIGTATVNITSWTLTLSGNTIATSMNGTAAVSVISCTPTSSGTLSRNATDGGTG